VLARDMVVQLAGVWRNTGASYPASHADIERLAGFCPGVSHADLGRHRFITALCIRLERKATTELEDRETARMRTNWKKIGYGSLSVALFILSIQLLKEGASVIAPYIEGWLDVDNPANSLGFGWLFAYIIMSGSPVAAVGLTLYDANVLSQLETLTMISGSRLGASFIVLFIGFIYVLRGQERLAGLSMGLLSFIITGILHLPGLLIGYLMLANGIADVIRLEGGAAFASIIDLIYGPVIQLVMRHAPGWLVFVMGGGLVLVSFNLLDRALPEVNLESSQFGAVSRVIYRPIVMFAVGLVVTALSMSVSISLSILVPLSARGYMRSENAIAYIMGANVSTFIDTLLVALLLGNPSATAVVLVQMASITIVALFTLTLIYRQFERAVLRLISLIGASTRNLVIFAVTILVTPIVLMIL
jgi:sodium-dependent phosphate cotransporter